MRAEFPQFDAAKTLAGDGPVLFTGESVHPWTFDCDPALRPLRETAGLLAARTDWPPLYDPDAPRRQRGAGGRGRLPRRHVRRHRPLAADGARTIRGLRTWVTDEFEHDGVRAGGPRVLDRLLALARDEV